MTSNSEQRLTNQVSAQWIKPVISDPRREWEEPKLQVYPGRDTANADGATNDGANLS